MKGYDFMIAMNKVVPPHRMKITNLNFHKQGFKFLFKIFGYKIKNSYLLGKASLFYY